jgi:hypothetical protein
MLEHVKKKPIMPKTKMLEDSKIWIVKIQMSQQIKNPKKQKTNAQKWQKTE